MEIEFEVAKFLESPHSELLLSSETSIQPKTEDPLQSEKKNKKTLPGTNLPYYWKFARANADNYSFGSRQPRKIFPHSHPPTRLGNKFLPLRGTPHTGPGSYEATDWNGLAYRLSKIPTSAKGYSIGARTALRFKPISKDVTPYPGMYQNVNTGDEKHKQSFAPFNILMPRFRSDLKDTSSYPGPGTYNPEKKPLPKVTWPMKFGSPDWAQVPCLEKRTLKAELSTDKDFRKHRNRVAYFRLFYD